MSLSQDTARKIRDILFQRFQENYWDEYLAFYRQQKDSNQDNSTNSRHESASTPAEDADVTTWLKAEFESRFKYLKRVPGGYSAFQGSQGPSKDDSNCWDAGVAYEVCQYGPSLFVRDARFSNMAGMVSPRQQGLCVCCTVSTVSPKLSCRPLQQACSEEAT
jgi:hypothetical protein